jgi:hypothetical protein
VYSGSDSGIDEYGKAIYAIVFILSIVLAIVIIYSIVKFARFRLTSLAFQRETIIAVVIGVVSTTTSFIYIDFLGGSFAAVQLFFAVWLLVYAIRVRRRVLKGRVLEMKRPVTGREEEQFDVELEERRRDPSPPPPYQPPQPQDTVILKISEDLTIAAPSASEATSSVTTSRRPIVPPKEGREFV